MILLLLMIGWGALSAAVGASLPWAIFLAVVMPFVSMVVVEVFARSYEYVASRYARTRVARKRQGEKARRRHEKTLKDRLQTRNRRGF